MKRCIIFIALMLITNSLMATDCRVSETIFGKKVMSQESGHGGPYSYNYYTGRENNKCGLPAGQIVPLKYSGCYKKGSSKCEIGYLGCKRLHSVYNNKQIDVTTLTLAQIREKQISGELFAVGLWQFAPVTIKSILSRGIVSSDTVFNRETQMMLFDEYSIKIARPKAYAYFFGDGDIEAAARTLAQEWSMPVKKGSERADGSIAKDDCQSYYNNGVDSTHGYCYQEFIEDLKKSKQQLAEGNCTTYDEDDENESNTTAADEQPPEVEQIEVVEVQAESSSPAALRVLADEHKWVNNTHAAQAVRIHQLTELYLGLFTANAEWNLGLQKYKMRAANRHICKLAAA